MRTVYRIFQYGWANGAFELTQKDHMLYAKTSTGKFQINCHNEEEAMMLYHAINAQPLLFNHLNWCRVDDLTTCLPYFNTGGVQYEESAPGHARDCMCNECAEWAL